MTTHPSSPLTIRMSAHLNMLRGLAAIAVLFGHTRGLFFKEYPSLVSPSAPIAALYGITGLGHQAVMLFFVMSGFLVGGSVLGSTPRWKWGRYLISRFTRLYIVLVPALLLTIVVDRVSMSNKAGDAFFNYPITHFTPVPYADKMSALTFLGNLAFLQTITTPTFGTNGPLWSLANECWYYILFPFIISIGRWRVAPAYATVGFLASVALSVWLPTGMLYGFLIWLLGVAVWCSPMVPTGRFVRIGLLVTSLGILCTTLLLSRFHLIPPGLDDHIVGLAFAVWVFLLVRVPAKNEGINHLYANVSRYVSKCSYSVYAIHFPLIMWWRTAIGTDRWDPTAWNLFVWAFGTTIVFLLGAGFAYLTERHTETVRSALAKRWAS